MMYMVKVSFFLVFLSYQGICTAEMEIWNKETNHFHSSHSLQQVIVQQTLLLATPTNVSYAHHVSHAHHVQPYNNTLW